MKYLFLLALLTFPLPAGANEYAPVTFTTAAGDLAVCSPISRGVWHGYVKATGTWGGGTLTLYKTYDGGTTKLPITDLTGVASTLTADGMSHEISEPQAANLNKTLKIWAILTGSTDATLSVSCLD